MEEKINQNEKILYELINKQNAELNEESNQLEMSIRKKIKQSKEVLDLKVIVSNLLK